MSGKAPLFRVKSKDIAAAPPLFDAAGIGGVAAGTYISLNGKV